MGQIQINQDISRHIQPYLDIQTCPDMSRQSRQIWSKQLLGEVLTHVNTWEIWVLRQVYKQCVNVQTHALLMARYVPSQTANVTHNLFITLLSGCHLSIQ